MRTKIVLLTFSALLFTAGILVKACELQKAHAADRKPLPYLGVTVKNDATVVNVIPGSPAYKAGIKPGDVVTSLRGETVHNYAEFHKIMLSCHPGEKISIGVLRTPTQGLTFLITLAEFTQDVLKPISRYDVLEWNGPDDPQFWKYGSDLVTVYYFTATWCAPCKELRPHIEKVYQQFKNNPRFRFVAVAISDSKNDRDEYKALIKLQKKGHYPFSIMRSQSIWKDLKIETVPTVIVVNQIGYIVGEYHGKDLLPDKCATLMKELDLTTNNLVPNTPHWP